MRSRQQMQKQLEEEQLVEANPELASLSEREPDSHASRCPFGLHCVHAPAQAARTSCDFELTSNGSPGHRSGEEDLVLEAKSGRRGSSAPTWGRRGVRALEQFQSVAKVIRSRAQTPSMPAAQTAKRVGTADFFSAAGVPALFVDLTAGAWVRAGRVALIEVISLSRRGAGAIHPTASRRLRMMSLIGSRLASISPPFR